MLVSETVCSHMNTRNQLVTEDERPASISSFGSHLGDSEDGEGDEDVEEATVGRGVRRGRGDQGRRGWVSEGIDASKNHPHQDSVAFMEQLRQHNLKIRRQQATAHVVFEPPDKVRRAWGC